MFLVPVLPLMVFLAIGMHSAWRRGKLTVTAKPLWWLLGAAVLLSIAIQGLVFKEFHPVGLIGFSFGFWIIFSPCSSRYGGCARSKRSPRRCSGCPLPT